MKVFDASENLAQRADEFNDALTGGRRLLDSNVDRAKLAQWLEEQRDAALLRMQDTAGLNDSQIETIGREFPYYHQLFLAIEEGRDPLAESLDEIGYLRSVNKQDQVREYAEYHRRLLAVLSNPEFRVATSEGIDPTDVLRTGLDSADAPVPSLGENFQTAVLNAELSEPDIANVPGRHRRSGRWRLRRQPPNPRRPRWRGGPRATTRQSAALDG